jgi:hypothetical protein
MAYNMLLILVATTIYLVFLSTYTFLYVEELLNISMEVNDDYYGTCLLANNHQTKQF